jgi:hypothetical protein
MRSIETTMGANDDDSVGCKTEQKKTIAAPARSELPAFADEGAPGRQETPTEGIPPKGSRMATGHMYAHVYITIYSCMYIYM